VQKRLNGEALEEYVKPIGGGYFFLPGVIDTTLSGNRCSKPDACPKGQGVSAVFPFPALFHFSVILCRNSLHCNENYLLSICKNKLH
jgi:hypothetical protein